MNTGYLFLFAYILLVGTATFLQKFVMSKITPFQLEFLIGLGMLIVSAPVLFWQQKSLAIPIKDAPVAALVGLGFALGSFVYVLAVSKLPVGIASAISTGYVVVALLLSVVFLKEPVSPLKLLGVFLTVVGVVILSLVQK
jgi:drug/metabolite transporter (DMT)-like permease